MGKQYDTYLKEHIRNVRKAAEWMITHYIVTDSRVIEKLKETVLDHDMSKWSDAEYDAYDAYFYGEDGRTEKVKEAFDGAWLHHIHENPHHWQHWVLINDDDGTKALEMPLWYVYEMIADWWSFSWKNENRYEIFNWYADHSEKMILHKNTRKLVDDILDRIETELNSSEKAEEFNDGNRN